MKKIFDTDDKREALLRAFDAGRKIEELCADFSCERNALERELKRHGRKASRRNIPVVKSGRNDRLMLSDNQDFIVAYMSGRSASSIADEFGVSKGSVWKYSKIIQSKGINPAFRLANRANTFDYNFFDKIDTAEKAYCLGLIAADGCNIGYRMTISLRDYQLVKDVMIAMSAVPGEPLVNRSKLKTRSDTYTFNASSRHLCERLTEKGCPSAKSLILEFPSHDQVPKELTRHFVRGYFDGDGSVFKTKKGMVHIDILGTEKFLSSLQSMMPCTSYVMPTRSKAWSLKIYAQNDVRRFAEWIYADASLLLQRKFAKFRLA